ncbi:MAG: ABC transporter ATP-binding protein [Syntrophorhabdaceae bacterium]|nr:ABC transporter ATP-binding protein [Syntrophorhabdaceae bacterium]
MSETILSAKGIKKSFNRNRTEIPILKGIDLDISENDFITIMGPSGAGKSTFLHILGTLDRPSEGEIYYKGRNIWDFPENEMCMFRNEKLGFVFQFYHLLQDFTVIENIMVPMLIKRLPSKEAEKRASQYLEIIGLTHRRDHKPGELSGGEQQRVAIARALVNEPEIILADEPTGNLDRKTGKEVLDYLLKVNREVSSTLIMVTHDPEIASLGKRRFKMMDGELFSTEY